MLKFADSIAQIQRQIGEKQVWKIDRFCQMLKSGFPEFKISSWFINDVDSSTGRFDESKTEKAGYIALALEYSR